MSAASYLRAATRLAEARRTEEAIAHLREGIRVAREQGDLAGVASLAGQAAVHCTHLGQLAAAAALYEEAAQCDPEDPYKQLAIGDIHAMLGDEARAAIHWNLFSEMASASMDADLLELLAAHLARRQRLTR
jgi:tetratricopeptide (TPR) repeat protein